MKIGKIIAGLGILAMTAALVYGFTMGDFGADGALILTNPWGIVSLVDLYTGFVLFSMWIYFRESNILVAILWIVAMMILGFFTGAVYVLYAFLTSKNDWLTFFLGSRKAKLV
ncbi:MAG: hypothetical protein CVU96_01215 [Firmicutes bacterium HGW-Firmicutes-20]|jgi:hypothetical protein|nr:MAG: hypothetical protein CVU96_01215 [Firmicutes bacterium HGW-Firmicutes-20]PKM69665.1 MAG: hypothetical protein CVU94_02800 [Firmicutes bacterium HGW-Firmicutes-19]